MIQCLALDQVLELRGQKLELRLIEIAEKEVLKLCSWFLSGSLLCYV